MISLIECTILKLLRCNQSAVRSHTMLSAPLDITCNASDYLRTKSAVNVEGLQGFMARAGQSMHVTTISQALHKAIHTAYYPKKPYPLWQHYVFTQQEQDD